jgi:large subunit ribosomal protein L25
MHTIALQARPKNLSGSSISGQIRRAGLLPAILYGEGIGSHAVAVDPKPVKKGLTSAWGRNQMFEVTFEGKTHLALAKEVQLHPVSRQLVHVDLFVVQPNTQITVTLPVVLSGRSAGQKAGGRLEQITRYVKVSCTPTTLPRLVEIDVTPFENGFTMGIDDLPLPEGVKPVYKKAYKIMEIIAPKVEEKPVVETKKKK